MSLEKRDYHECHHVQKCSFQPINKSNELRDLSYLVSQTFKPSYATFYSSTDSPAIPVNNSFIFDKTGVKTSDIDISLDKKIITVKTAGFYTINYRLVFMRDLPNPGFAFQVALYINNITDMLQSSGFGFPNSTGAPAGKLCMPVSHNFQVYIPANSTLYLNNVSTAAISVCNNAGPSAIITIQRIA